MYDLSLDTAVTRSSPVVSTDINDMIKRIQKIIKEGMCT